MKHYRHAFVYANAIIIAIALAVFGYWNFIDGVYVGVPLIDKADMTSIMTDKLVYEPGETIQVSNSFCKSRDLPATITAQFVDGEIISLSSKDNNLPVGCYGIDKPYTQDIAMIPKIISPGVWHLQWDVVYQINPVKTITYHRRTRDFTILSPKLPIPAN